MHYITQVTKEQMYEFSSYEVPQPQSEQMYEFCSYEVLQPQSEQMYEFSCYAVPQTQSKYSDYVSGGISESDPCMSCYTGTSLVHACTILKKYRILFPVWRKTFIWLQLLMRMHYTTNYHRVGLRISIEILSGQLIITTAWYNMSFLYLRIIISLSLCNYDKAIV